jgi:hypothetical protein
MAISSTYEKSRYGNKVRHEKGMIERCRASIVEHLLEAGAAVNTPGQPYSPALEVAIEMGYKKIIELLRARGAVTRDELDFGVEEVISADESDDESSTGMEADSVDDSDDESSSGMEADSNGREKCLYDDERSQCFANSGATY